MKPGDDPDNPKLKQVQAALARNPTLPMRHLRVAFELGAPTLEAWIAHGWITVIKQRNGTNLRFGKAK